MSTINIDLHARVRVDLTRRGLEVYNNALKTAHLVPVEGETLRLEIPLWYLMMIFGSSMMFNSVEPLFINNNLSVIVGYDDVSP